MLLGAGTEGIGAAGDGGGAAGVGDEVGAGAGDATLSLAACA